MTIVDHAARADVPVIIVDQSRLSDDLGLQELYEEILRELERTAAWNVIVDLELVDTVTSAGLGMLIRAKLKSDEKRACLHLCGLRPNVAKVMHLTSLKKLFPLHDNVATALRTIARCPRPAASSLAAQTPRRSPDDRRPRRNRPT